MERAEAMLRRFLGSRLQFYLVWVPLVVVAILVWAWRSVARDNLPFWATSLAYLSLIFAVMLPVQRAYYRQRQGSGGGQGADSRETR
jgi:cytochrome bd-type quinol oxidase subunit 2